LRDAQRTFKLDRIVQLSRIEAGAAAVPTCEPVVEENDPGAPQANTPGADAKEEGTPFVG